MLHSLILAFLGGFLTVLSPCILPVLPIILGRALRSHRFGPLALVLGLVVGFATVGSLIGVTFSWLGELASWLRSLALFLLLLFGVLALFPELSTQVFSYLNLNRWVKEPTQQGWQGEFWLGTQLGLVWSPCAGPVLGSIITLAAVNHAGLAAFGLLLVYGVGAAVPMVTIAYGGRYLSGRLLGLRTQAPLLQRVGGVLVVMSAVAILLGWDVQIQLLLAPYFPPLML